MRKLIEIATISALIMACSSVPALAGYGLTGSFGSATSTPQDSEPLSSPSGVAVNESTGDVYVVDQGNNRIQRFSASGNPVSFSALGTSSLSGTPAEAFSLAGFAGGAHEVPASANGIAVDDDPSSASHGDLYVIDTGHGVVDKFQADGEYIGQLTETPIVVREGLAVLGGSFDRPGASLRGVAVDPEGDVWIYVKNPEELGEVFEFSSMGAYITGFATGHETTPGIAVGPAGQIFVASGNGNVKEYAISGETMVGPRGENVESDEDAAGLGSDAANGRLYISQGSTIGVYGPEPLSEPPVESFGASVLAGGAGIAVDASSHAVYVTDSAKNQVDIFEEQPPPPTPTTTPATQLTRVTAELNGELDPEGGGDYYFSYNVGESCTGAGSSKTPLDNGGSPATGAGPVKEAAEATGLAAGTQYVFCIVAKNAFGETPGPAVPFSTSPAVEGVSTGEAGDVSATTATLHGSLEPNGLDARYYFEYATDSEYEATKEYRLTSPAPPGTDAGEAPGSASAETSTDRLRPITAYHYRIVATNSLGTTHGPNETFTTLPLPPVVTTDPPATIGSVTATLAGEVAPQGAPTTYRIEYGTTAAYGITTPAPEGSVGSSIGGQFVTAPVGSLTPGASYHYRIVATNAGGTTEGHDAMFTTDAAGDLDTEGALPPGFSLTGVAPPAPAAVIYPSLTSVSPLSPPAPTKASKPPTKAQQLARALKACEKNGPRRQRATCEKIARKKYGAKLTTKKEQRK